MLRPTLAALMFCAMLFVPATRADADVVALLIDQTLYDQGQVAAKLARYETEVEARFPADLQIHVGTFASQSAAQVRAFIQNEYNTIGISGVILVGQLPYVIWEQDPTFGTNHGILAFYYEDLDGTFTDQDADGWLDYHTWGTNDGPEIWSCWMRPPVMDEAGYLEALLDKAHAYYAGEFVTGKRGLVACHSDYDNNFWPSGSTIPSMPALVDIYGLTNVATDGEGTDLVVASELNQLLSSTRYEIAHFWGHANSILQAWDSGYLYNTDILSFPTGNGPLIAHIYGCHSGDFIYHEGTSASNTTIAVAYAFSNGGGQAASGTSWSYGTEGMNYITEAMGDGAYLGAAWKHLLDIRENSVAIHQRYSNRDVCKELSGNSLFGNPFLYANWTGYAYEAGDLNCDGMLDLFDIDPFVIALTSASETPPFGTYDALYPDCDPLLADANGDEVVDLFDIDPFVEMLTAK